MKGCLLLALVICLCAWPLSAEIIAQWNFNSATPDGSPSTGSTNPSAGSGSAFLINGTSATFSTGSTNDPATSFDDSGWNTSSYPPDGSSNKTAGVQFNVDTQGYTNIVVRWDLRVSSAASKYYRLLYSSDGVNYSDSANPAATLNVVSTASYYEAQTNDLRAIGELADNPNVSFRIVSEFQSTAAGSGTNGYVTTSGTNNYSRSGTVRFDWVTVLGTPIPGANTPPGISSLSNLTLRVNSTSPPLGFTVSDAQDPPGALTLNKSSSDPGVIAEAGIQFGGSGSARTVALTTGGQTGVTIITLYVFDSGGRSNSTSFLVTVLPANTAPFISSLSPTNTLADQPTYPLAFSVGDLETEAAALLLSAQSANPLLLPEANISFGGSGSNRSVTLSPAAGQIGVAPVTVTVSDGTNLASTRFPLMVTPSASVIFFEPFAYPDGSVLTNSAFLWDNRSGTLGQAQVTNGQLLVTTSQTEDVVGALSGSPYNVSNNAVLYAAFKAVFLSLPKNVPEYFAHFANGSTLRGRVFAGTTNAAAGAFRLQVANGSDNVTELPVDLQTNQTYTIVTRYDVDKALTTLWIDPALETDPSVTAADSQNGTRIVSYGFRQDSGLGAALLVDDLKVGLSFAAVTSTNIVLSPVHLKIQRVANQIIVSWPDNAYALQTAPAVVGPFTNVVGALSPYTNSAGGALRFFRLKAN